ncbi:putative o-methyltransferase protein [Botrytis cinerea BcDW1]|uniref:Putative o-methyltransferase protein n=1 Tax=Botryotinia fuckeliana (strain BcDW1) TaxID=1290391 RepID=M7TNZ6_BOTF1|nr:putative o-methyltransferase protein [Botrytis cinerea BcDW1]
MVSNGISNGTNSVNGFERDTPIINLSPDAPEEAQIAKEKLLDSAFQIFQLVSGPGECLQNDITGVDPRPHGYDKPSIAEPEPGFIAHSAISAALVTNTRFSDQRAWMTSIIAPVIASMVNAHERWPDSTAPNNAAFNAAFNTDLRMYEYIAKQPDVYKLFGRVMDAIATSPKSDLKHLIGGIIGHSCVKLAEAFPDLNFIIQDIPHVVEEGAKVIKENNEASIANHIQFQEYDFFQKQPVNSVKILGNTVESMGQQLHVLIMDFVVPGPGTVSSVNERVLRSRDVGMMQLFNSLERDLEGWKAILEAVDSRLKINAVNTPYGSFISVIALWWQNPRLTKWLLC